MYDPPANQRRVSSRLASNPWRGLELGPASILCFRGVGVRLIRVRESDQETIFDARGGGLFSFPSGALRHAVERARQSVSGTGEEDTRKRFLSVWYARSRIAGTVAVAVVVRADRSVSFLVRTRQREHSKLGRTTNICETRNRVYVASRRVVSCRAARAKGRAVARQSASRRLRSRKAGR